MGQGFNFRPGVFDGAVSISALQWLCVAGKKCDNPYKRLNTFFSSLYKCLRTGGRAVLQFYPDGKDQIEMITTSALKQGDFYLRKIHEFSRKFLGFSGGVVIDFPNSSKAKKLYLVIDAGGVGTNHDIVMIEGLKEEAEGEEEDKNEIENVEKSYVFFSLA